MVRSRAKLINPPAVSTRSTDDLLHHIRDSAMESHALARAIANEFCGSPVGSVPEWVEKLVDMTEHSTGITVDGIDELQRRQP